MGCMASVQTPELLEAFRERLGMVGSIANLTKQHHNMLPVSKERIHICMAYQNIKCNIWILCDPAKQDDEATHTNTMILLVHPRATL